MYEIRMKFESGWRRIANAQFPTHDEAEIYAQKHFPPGQWFIINLEEANQQAILARHKPQEAYLNRLLRRLHEKWSRYNL